MKKIKKYSIIIIFTIVAINSLLYIKYFNNNSNKEQPMGLELNSIIGELKEDDSISQEFLCKYDNFEGIKIFFSTYNRKNKGTLYLYLKDDSGNVIRNVELNLSELKDNSYEVIDIDKINRTKGKSYELQIKGGKGLQEGNSVTLWNSNHKDKSYSINNKVNNGSIVFTLLFNNKPDFKEIILINAFFIFINILLYNIASFLRK